MKNLKILAAAAGFAVAAGALTAGDIYVGQERVGSYSGNATLSANGDITFPSGTPIGGTDDGEPASGPSCDTATAQVNTAGTGCVCRSGYEYNNVEGGSVPQNTACTAVDDGGSDGGGSTPTSCEGVGTNLARSSVMTQFSPFPQNDGESFTLEIRDSQYVAISFTAPSSGYTAALSSKKHTMTNANHVMAISSCPGDFAQRLPSANCRKDGTATNQIWFNTTAAYANGYLCDLTPGETYYLNIAYAQGTGNNLTSTCPGSRCGSLFSWSEY